MLRTVLILTAAIGLGAIAVTESVVRPHIGSIIARRDRNQADLQSEQRVHGITKANLEIASAKLEKAEKSLSDTKGELAAMSAKAAEQQQRATALEGDLAKTKEELGAAKADLAAWAGLPPVEQIKGVFAEVKRLRAANETTQQEKDILLSAVKRAQWIIRDRAPEDPELPAGLKGKVVVVDPKFDFVVLDIGADQGVERRGVLLIAREGELVGKVRVASVQSDRSVANVVPGWKLREIREGDLVLY